MKKSDIMIKMSSTFHRAKFQVVKHSPEILVITGIVGTVASTVIACKATTKLSGILEKTKEESNIIRNYAASDVRDIEEYTDSDVKKDLVIVYAKAGLELVKLYGPAVALGTLSITSILASNNILRKRNIALAAAYATIDKSFKEYRQRVADRFGTETEKEIRYNIKAKKYEEEITDEKGKVKKVKVTKELSELSKHSDWAMYFDNRSKDWEETYGYNLSFLKAQESYLNDMLKIEKRVFLNDVYDAIGMPKTKAGQYVGWDLTNPNSDHFVDFGIFETYRELEDGDYEQVIILDFNVVDILSDMPDDEN